MDELYILNSFHDVSCSFRTIERRYAESHDDYTKRDNEERRKDREQEEKDRDWRSYGPVGCTEEESLVFLDRLGWERSWKMVEYSGLDFQEAWTWRHKDSNVEWWLRKVTHADVERWSANGQWKLQPLSEIPEDRLYPQVANARFGLNRLEQLVLHKEKEVQKAQEELEKLRKRVEEQKGVIRELEVQKIPIIPELV